MNFSSLLLAAVLVGHGLFGLDRPQGLSQLLRSGGAEASVSARIVDGAPLRHNQELGDQAQGGNARGLQAKAIETDSDKFSVGIGLTGVYDWSAQQPFLDVMKTARPWVVHKPGQWGGAGQAELAAAGVLDKNGWLTRLPRELGSVGTLILTDMPSNAASLAGRYRLRFEGTGIVEVLGRATNKTYEKNGVSFDYTPGPGFVEIRLRRNDPGKTGDYVRNITVVKEANAARYARGEIFNPDWLARLRPFDTLRFMDWMATNNSTQMHWADRPKPADYTYAVRGVPVEVMVELANQVGANAWFNMPHKADDDYVRRFAGVVRDGLRARSRVYMEYSNEVWNWMFDQTKWASARADQLWGNKDAGVQFYGIRAAQMARIWSEVFAETGQPVAELVNVISTQTGWLGLERDILAPPLWPKHHMGLDRAPFTYFDAYAVTGYFGGILGTKERAPLVRRWLQESRHAAEDAAKARGLTAGAASVYIAEHAFDMADKWAGQELIAGDLSGDDRDTLADLLGRVLPYHANVAAGLNMEFLVYEGGTHVVGIGALVDDPELAEFFTHFNYSDEMGKLYERLLQGWHRLGGGQFNAFADVNVPSKWGSWGNLRYLSDDNPRWRALLSAIRCEDDCGNL